jgi:multidrug efflux pump subunit AcrA (membrane-fusion protein)
MTKTSHLLPLSLALSAALLLGACSRDAPAQAPAGASTATAGKVAVARGIIDVEGGLIALAPPVDGSITAAPVKEGATVKKGQLLLSLDGALLQQEVAMATADLALANDRLKGSQAQLRELERNATRLSTASEGVSSNQQADAAKQLAGGTRRCRRGRCAGRHGPAQAGTRQAETAADVAERAGSRHRGRPGAGPRRLRAGRQAGDLAAAGAPAAGACRTQRAYADAVQVGMKATVVPDSDGAENTSTLPPARVVRISPVFAQARLPEDAGRGVAKVVECVLEFDGEAKARFGQHVRVEFRK